VVSHQAAELARRGIRRVADAQAADDAVTRHRHVPERAGVASPVEGAPASATPPLSTWSPLSFADDLSPDDADLTLLTTETAYQDALTASAKLQIPSLVAFLR
jgi:hypothetical protein